MGGTTKVQHCIRCTSWGVECHSGFGWFRAGIFNGGMIWNMGARSDTGVTFGAGHCCRFMGGCDVARALTRLQRNRRMQVFHVIPYVRWVDVNFVCLSQLVTLASCFNRRSQLSHCYLTWRSTCTLACLSLCMLFLRV